MVRRIQTWGTICIMLVLLTGTEIVFFTALSYGLKLRGNNGRITAWFTQNAEIDLSWEKDLYKQYGKYDNRKNIYGRIVAVVEGIEDNIEEFCTGAFPQCKAIKQFADYYRKVLLHNNMDIVGGKTNEEYVDEAVADIRGFNTFLQNRGVEFIYIQLPSPEWINACQGVEYSPEMFDRRNLFSEKMSLLGEQFLDIDCLYRDIGTFSLDHSNHWMPKDALKTTKVIANHMNEEYDYRFDLSKFDSDRYYNAMEKAEDKLNSICEDFGYEYEMLAPVADVQYWINDSEERFYEGSFEETLLAPMDKWDQRVSDGKGKDDIVIAYHNLFTIHNGGFLILRT